MNKSQYNRLRARALTPEFRAAVAEFQRTYDQLPEVIEGRARMAANERRRDIGIVNETVKKIAAQHPKIAKRYGITVGASYADLSKSLYDCYCDSGRQEPWLIAGHGSFVCDVDPYDLQAAWMAASRLR